MSTANLKDNINHFKIVIKWSIQNVHVTHTTKTESNHGDTEKPGRDKCAHIHVKL
uniref:Uncharacterized protein n=1 Tax=Arion vulgaris TaxID=1028688 RepID=A0A0B7APB7_9EUPU